MTSSWSEKGLTNYWGYNNIGYFAPAGRYAHGARVPRAGARVQGDGAQAPRGRHRGDPRRGLQPHRRGESPRADALLPGIDNPTYYRLVAGESAASTWTTPARGNSLNMVHPQTLKLVMDSLRYWVQEMHVDGFRFDLAATLARELHEVDRLSAFFDIIHQDPVLSQREADRRALGRGTRRVPGRQLPGALGGVEWEATATPCAPSGAAIPGTIAELGFRLTGSSDLYESRRSPARTPASTSSPPTTASR